ncbi:hypothetical protein SAMN04487772_106126 [[Clostridium] polysaccharolyticum]|uniref:Uncharacterized protein n=1 Tax=[Clostridium] polysaccharolyticum TaxID=29364 RepID=A0A1I0B0P6_9FIRM|nr:hypothetical protein SAMN04487772_106126 [[Clostridium] polysaccharolyticum]
MTTNKIVIEKFDNAVKSIVDKKVIEKKKGNEIVIIEDQKIAAKNSKNVQVRIRRIGNNSFAFKMDIRPHNVYLLDRPTMINDELVLRVEEEKITAFILELKSKDPKKARKQICYGKQYADFLIGILELEMDYFFKEKEYRGYVFTTNTKYRRPVVRSGYLSKEKTDQEIGDIYIKYLGDAPSYDFGELGLEIR